MDDSNTKNNGFILLVVLGILGTLSLLSISFAASSTLESKLSQNSLHQTYMRLIVRSGVELGMEKTAALTRNGFTDYLTGKFLPIDSHSSKWTSFLQLPVDNSFTVSVKGSSGSININDGISAGLSELGEDYDASALDPWPIEDAISNEGSFNYYQEGVGASIKDTSTTFPSSLKDSIIELSNDGVASYAVIQATTSLQTIYMIPYIDGAPDQYRIFQTNQSALINLRIRKILNAYGDVCRFVADYGWPTWSGDPASDLDTWQQPVTFTSSATADWSSPMPKGAGLGDLIIDNRPQGGYESLEEIKDMVNAWGQDQLTQVRESFLEGRTFFEFIKNDLTVRSFEDKNFYRIRREFGVRKEKFNPFDPGEEFFEREYKNLFYPEDNMIDFSSLWERHPVALINLNSASSFVRAAVFYAPSHVTYRYESGRYEKVTTFFTSSNPDSREITNFTPGMTVVEPLFHEDRRKENGLDSPIQLNRLMSLRDSLVLAQGYREYSEEKRYPDSFTAFAELLAELERGNLSGGAMQLYERGLAFGIHDDFIPTYPAGDPLESSFTHYWFRQSYVEKTLPHIFSCIRRIPSWMGAPLSLTSPYLRQQNPHYNKQGLISVEDFTYRFHLPKVCFYPCGQFILISEGQIPVDGQILRDEIHVNYKLFDTKFYRSQQEFDSLVDLTELDSRFQIGPEPSTFHSVLGVIGLNDRDESASQSFGHYPFGTILSFDGSDGQYFLETPKFDNYDEQIFPVLNTKNEAYLDPTDIFVDHKWPGPEPYASWPVNSSLPNQQAYDQTFINYLNQGGFNDRTWKIPHSDLLQKIKNSIQAYSLPMVLQIPGFPNLTTQNVKNFLRSKWNVSSTGFPQWGLNASGSPPNASDPIEKYFWELIRQPSVLSPFFSWSGSSNSFLSDLWSNGPPGVHTINASIFKDSELEIDDGISFFDSGSNSSDRTPFNGVLFSSFGHGPRAPKPFSDSLFFRPYFLMDEDYRQSGGELDTDSSNNVSIGEAMNKGMISFWFKVPQGNQYGQRCLFHMTLWENSELGLNTNYDPSNTLTIARANHFYAYLEPNYAGNILKVVRVSLENTDNLRPWSNALSLPQVSYPNDPVLSEQENYRYMGVPLASGSGALQLEVGRWFYDQTLMEVYTTSGFQPGTWHRVFIGWNFRNMHVDRSKRFWSFVGSSVPGHYSTGYDHSDIPSPLYLPAKMMPSYNDQMMISFGELPFYNMSNTNIVYSQNSDDTRRFVENDYVPLLRLNSQIDNINMRFGDDGFDNSWFGLQGTPPLDQADVYSQAEDLDHHFFSWRYDINSPGSSDPEPKLTLNFDRSFGGALNASSVIVAIGSRIYDVPYSVISPEYNPAPKVDINLERVQGGGVIAEAYASPEDTQGFLFQKGGSINTHSSQSIKAYNFKMDDSVRMTLTYRAESPDGKAIAPGQSNLTEIPWIKEVSIRYVDDISRFPKITSWSSKRH